jgi:hypothetical protein
LTNYPFGATAVSPTNNRRLLRIFTELYTAVTSC